MVSSKLSEIPVAVLRGTSISVGLSDGVLSGGQRGTISDSPRHPLLYRRLA